MRPPTAPRLDTKPAPSSRQYIARTRTTALRLTASRRTLPEHADTPTIALPNQSMTNRDLPATSGTRGTDTPRREGRCRLGSSRGHDRLPVESSGRPHWGVRCVAPASAAPPRHTDSGRRQDCDRSGRFGWEQDRGQWHWGDCDYGGHWGMRGNQWQWHHDRDYAPPMTPFGSAWVRAHSSALRREISGSGGETSTGEPVRLGP